jgi:tetratricopeptide (TPR) repeat protein
VALRPGQLPAQADAQRYLGAVAAAESSLSAAERTAAYRVATAAWPALATAHFALGNSLYAQRMQATAEASWRMAIVLQPGHAGAINNLAELLARSGRRGEALTLLDRALARRLEPESLRPVLQQTRLELAGSQSAAVARSKKAR